MIENVTLLGRRRERGERRALALYAAGAVLGLGLAAVSVFTSSSAGGGAAMSLDAVVRVNGTVLRITALERMVQGLYRVPLAEATAEQKAVARRRMIEEELLVQRGLEMGLARTEPTVREVLANAVLGNVGTELLATPPTADRLRAYFEAHRERYAEAGGVRLTDHLVAGGQGEAERAVAALKAGEPIAALAGRLGLGRGGLVPSGSLRSVQLRATFQPDELAALAALAPGQGLIITADDGVHLIVVEGRDPPPPVDFARVASRVAGDMRADEAEAAQLDYLAFLRNRAEILDAGEGGGR